MTPIGAWLKATRLRQVNPDTGRPWSQEYTAERIRVETGWNLHRENYNGYERGKGMQPDTQERLIKFWAARGEPGPDLTPPIVEPPPDLATALLALAKSNGDLAAELAWLREEREAQARAISALSGRIAALEAPASEVQSVPRETRR